MNTLLQFLSATSSGCTRNGANNHLFVKQSDAMWRDMSDKKQSKEKRREEKKRERERDEARQD